MVADNGTRGRLGGGSRDTKIGLLGLPEGQGKYYAQPWSSTEALRLPEQSPYSDLPQALGVSLAARN